jgi:hypothetical protein
LLNFCLIFNSPIYTAVQIRRDIKETGANVDASLKNPRKFSSETKPSVSESTAADESVCSTSSMKSSPHSDYVIGSPQSAFTPIISANGVLSPPLPNPISVLGSSTMLSMVGIF